MPKWGVMEGTSTSRSALITGAASATGQAAARLLAGLGWRIALTYRNSQRQAQALRDELVDAGVDVRLEQADLARASEVDDLAKRLAQWGGIDALVHTAGSFHRADILAEEPERWLASFDDNLHSAFYLARALAPGMQRRGWGRIVFFTLVNAEQGLAQPKITAHYLAKSSLMLLMRALAKRLAGDGITVNAIAPGFIETGGDALAEQPIEDIPAGRLGHTDDLMGALAYLLSEAPGYVTGTSIRVSGGWGI
jgi:3-oxoacyl-[acyl-carrier protein] reductase